MKLFDCMCSKCEYIWEDWLSDASDCGMCPRCDSAFTRTMPGGVRTQYKAKDPYDYLDRGLPDSKRIFSGPHARSK